MRIYHISMNPHTYHKISSASVFKRYKMYVLSHLPSTHSSRALMGYGMPRARNIIVKPDWRGTTCHEFFLYLERSINRTLHLVTKDKLSKAIQTNVFTRHFKKRKKIYTLLQQAFFALSTLDLSSMKNFYINPLFQEEQGGCWR